MINKSKALIITLATILFFSVAACKASAQTLNSPEALKEYLDKQPANSPNKPIRVSMGANDLMLPKIVAVLMDAGKYVSLSLTGNALTTIPDNAFYDRRTEKGCAALSAITIPNSATSIGEGAFYKCTSLASVTFEGKISSANFAVTNEYSDTFPGDLRAKYLAGGIGTYTRPNGSSNTWTKQ